MLPPIHAIVHSLALPARKTAESVHVGLIGEAVVILLPLRTLFHTVTHPHDRGP